MPVNSNGDIFTIVSAKEFLLPKAPSMSAANALAGSMPISAIKPMPVSSDKTIANNKTSACRNADWDSPLILMRSMIFIPAITFFLSRGQRRANPRESAFYTKLK
jgi:hypothetical protein